LFCRERKTVDSGFAGLFSQKDEIQQNVSQKFDKLMRKIDSSNIR